MRRKHFDIAGIFIVAVLGVGLSIFIASKSFQKSPKATPPHSKPPIASNIVINDYKSPGVEQVRAENKDKYDRYDLLTIYGEQKTQVGRYDEAIVYYQAAAEEVKDNKELYDITTYRLYRLAKLANNKALSDKYAAILGNDKLKSFENKKDASEAQ